jgi:hypothetical protein
MLKEYQCHKIVKAEPMTEREFAVMIDRTCNLHPTEPDKPGYHVVYADGYESWSPKAAFEAGYTEITTAPKGKTLDISEVKGAKANISDLKVYGDGDTFVLLCKASSQNEGWMKSTKVCNVPDGCILQVTTQQRNPDGSYSVAEAVTYVPGVHLNKFVEPRRLERI